ncbi:MAG TPA: ABC transporter substrate-binding protein [Methylomirabilota bacterium]|nr:ABC transporter substrate-binding protein [Methylomirabilota bacterium]
MPDAGLQEGEHLMVDATTSIHPQMPAGIQMRMPGIHLWIRHLAVEAQRCSRIVVMRMRRRPESPRFALDRAVRVITRRSGTVFVLILVLVPLLAFRSAAAQQSGKPYRLGFLSYRPCGQSLDTNGPFLQRLRELGYLEGRNLVLECRDAIGQFDRLPDLAIELARLNIDVLVSEGTPQSLAAKQATTTVPIVMVGVGDPVGNGLVASLARPGGNITGVAMFPTVDVVVKAIELLKEIAPGVSRLAVLWDPTNRALISIDEQLAAASRPLRIELHRISVRAPKDVEPALAVALDQRAHAFLLHPLPVAPRDMQRIWDVARAKRVPTVTFWEPYARQGVLLSYGPLVAEVYRSAAVLVDRVLKGAKPADLPVELPARLRMVINLETASAVGLTIPQSVLLRADEVIR